MCMYIFTFTKSTEKFIIWNTDIQSKISNGKYTTKMKELYSIFNNVLKLTDKSAKVIVQDIINELLDPMQVIGLVNNKLDHENITQFYNLKTLPP